MIKYEKYFFLVLVLLTLSIVIYPTIYVTGDGPSHTYNAKVWFDYLLNHNRAFYKPFYQLNKHIEPNYVSHILLGLFTLFLKPIIADKIFQIVYVLVFSFGFRQLIKAISNENSFLSFLFFPFMFSLAFQQGFYNYCIALGFMFWTLAYFINHINELQDIKKLFWLFVLLLLAVLSHGMVAGYCIAIMFFLWLYFRWKDVLQLNVTFLFEDSLRLVLIITPILLILFSFIFRVGIESQPHHLSHIQKWIYFLQCKGFQSTRHLEMYPAICFSLFLSIGLILYLLQIGKAKTIGLIFLSMSVYFLYSFIHSPHSIGGAGSIHVRLSILPLLFLLFALASAQWSDTQKKITYIFSFLLLSIFLIIRFPFVLKASEISVEMLACSKNIKAKKVVLNLHMNDFGVNEKKDSLFQRDRSFIHLTDYLGAEKNKPIVLLNNYEADIAYFPLQWRENKQPNKIIYGLMTGNYPPCDNYKKYEQKTNVPIDYILFQQWKNEAIKDSAFCKMMYNIDLDFTLVFKSKHDLLRLYEKK